MSTPFIVGTGGDSKKIDAEKIPTGMRLCTFHSIVDVGTQEGGQYGPKHRVYLGFEFPQELRVFWEGDEAKPCNIWTMQTMSMHEKSSLRKSYIEPMIGKKLSDTEANAFDMSTLMGKQYIATIAHSADGKYANIVSLTPLTEQGKSMFGITGPIDQYNNESFFHLSMGFQSDNYKSVPKFLRDKIQLSSEGVSFTTAGGTFPVIDNTYAPPAVTGMPSVLPSLKKLVMLESSTHTELQLITAGWTQQQIVDNGYGKWQEATAPPKPVGATPPPLPPVPPTPPVVSAPSSEPVFTMNDPDAIEADYITLGWTRETLVQSGHASFVTPIASIPPSAPPLPTGNPHMEEDEDDEVPF